MCGGPERVTRTELTFQMWSKHVVTWAYDIPGQCEWQVWAHSGANTHHKGKYTVGRAVQEKSEACSWDKEEQLFI